MERKMPMAKRVGIYLLGIVLVSLGIILCKKCNLGISPISSIPFVLEDIVPVSFGMLTIFFHLANIILQLLLVHKIKDIQILLQIPVAVLFGQIIDILQKYVNFDNELIVNQTIALILSIFFTALGMVCMISMDLVQNPPDGLVRAVSRKTEKELGKIKIIYDVGCVLISIVIGLIFLGKVRGMGIATVASAVLWGRR